MFGSVTKMLETTLDDGLFDIGKTEESFEDILNQHVIGDTPQSFSKAVEDLVWDKDIPYLEAITQIMQEKNYEPEVVPKLLTPELYSKLEIQAEKEYLIKKQHNRLPI